jgi:hypothetical protein
MSVPSIQRRQSVEKEGNQYNRDEDQQFDDVV